MALEVILCAFFLFIALLIYSIFAGADFGMGVMEILLKRRHPAIADITKKVIGPVWEANHVWLVIVIVILFIAFPKAFSVLCIHLHVPLFLVLIGIVIRGCAFSFRHYDPFKDRSHLLHDQLFRWSSMITPFFFGSAMTALVGTFPTEGSYFRMYLAPFLAPSSLLGGVFFMMLFTYSAWALLVSDHDSVALEETLLSWRGAITSVMAGVSALAFCGVFITKHADYFLSPGVLLGAALVLLALMVPLVSSHRWLIRGGLALLHTSILGTLFYLMFPFILQNTDKSFTWTQSAAPSQVLWVLITTLMVGLLIIGPNLVILLRVFKSSQK